MGGAFALKDYKIGGVPRELDRHGTGWASVFVFVGGERNVTGQASFMWDIIYHMEGDKSMDIGKTNWALMRAKTNFVKGCKLIQKGVYKKNDDDTRLN